MDTTRLFRAIFWPLITVAAAGGVSSGCGASSSDPGTTAVDSGASPDASGTGGMVSTIDAGTGGFSIDAGLPPDAGPPTGRTIPEFPENCGAAKHCDPGVPTDAPDLFSGEASSAGAPKVLYPLANSLHPINFAQLTLQWTRDPAHTLFRVSIAGADQTWELYVPCQLSEQVPVDTECWFTLNEDAWQRIAWESRGGSVTLTLSGTDGAGGEVASSEPLQLSFSEADLRGAVYYWATNLQGILRALADSPKAVPFIPPRTARNGEACAGCHSVSRDGRIIAFSAGGQAFSAELQVAPTQDPGAPVVEPEDEHDSSMIALNPDGSRLVTAVDFELRLHDAESGALLETLTAADFGGKTPFFPEWSPDGKEIAVTLSVPTTTDWAVSSGDIAVIPYNDGAFGDAEIIVEGTAEEFHFYPSWSPDGKWLVFASAPIGEESPDVPRTSYNQAQSSLHLVSRSGGTVYDLDAATQEVGATSTWPKFTPFAQRDGQLLFFTFNSKIDYGHLLKNSARDGNQRTPQLWLAAIDLDRLDSGDPSLAPVWLPQQEVGQNNHLAFWTKAILCDEDPSVCDNGQVCKDGNCVTNIIR